MKKAQGQIITTILIILLVLAAIVIVWQVVNRTVSIGSAEIDAQSKCIGFSINIRSVVAGTDVIVSGTPSKTVESLTFYKNGGEIGGSTSQIVVGTSSDSDATTFVVGDKITASGVLTGQLCPGLNEVIVKAP